MTVEPRRRRRATVPALFALVTFLMLSMSAPASAHSVYKHAVIFDRIGDMRGTFSYTHTRGKQNKFVLTDRVNDGYNVTATISRKSGSSWVNWRAMSATNKTAQIDFCSIPNGQARITLQSWVISDGLSRTETYFWNTTNCNH